ncbi:MAG TPA: magnesium transporter CorA family protein [Polyangia bacterium]
MILTRPTGDPSAAVWIDLLQPTDEEIALVREATGLRVPTESQVSEIESTSRLAFEGGAFYLSAPLVAVGDSGEHQTTPVGFVLSSRVLLTIHFVPLAAFDVFGDEAARQPPKDAEEALLRIFELVVDRAADNLERAGAACDELSRAAFRGGGARAKVANKLSAALRRIGATAEQISRMRDELLGLGRVAAYVMESGIVGAPPVNGTRLKAIRADIASLTDYEAHLSGKLQFLLDATLGFINIEQNDIVKTLTIASVVGIPPVLVAGIYGMNFRVMPELRWALGYPMALGLIIVSGLLPLWWFKRRGWM